MHECTGKEIYMLRVPLAIYLPSLRAEPKKVHLPITVSWPIVTAQKQIH